MYVPTKVPSVIANMYVYIATLCMCVAMHYNYLYSSTGSCNY